jgi:hypothetical protein
MSKRYFSLYEITVMSLLGALTAVLQIALRLPLGVAGHTGIYLVIPIIIGVAIVRKPGSGTYIGLIFGLISAFYGAGDNPDYAVFFRYFAMGFSVDVLAIPFRGYLDNPLVGIILGTVSNVSKLAVMFVIDTMIGMPMGFLVLGLGTACILHVIFGAIGGILSALVLKRLYKGGVIRKNEQPAG